MSKFNTTKSTPTLTTSPIKTAAVSTLRTANGAPGFERDAKSELFLLAVANMVGEKTFYEEASKRDSRFEQLVRAVAVQDTDWFERFVAWLRGPEGSMRSASLVAAAEGVKALLDAGSPVAKRGIISSALQRADEPGELIAYWTQKHGRAIPKPIKRGIADAVQRLYTEYATLKYDTQSSGVRFADVLALTHPEPGHEPQARIFEWINARRWGRDGDETFGLGMVEARLRADRMSRDELLVNSELIKAAGYTWENVAGKGKMDARAWEAVIPSMGYMALLRNLRNFDQAGISSSATDAVRARLVDPEQVKRSRQFPFRFLSAYQALGSDTYSRELETALDLSLSNVPALSGRTLVLVDRSGSMYWDTLGGSLGSMTRADGAALFGTALALRAEHADLFEYGTSHRRITFSRGDGVLKKINSFSDMGGTNTAKTVNELFRPGFHDRVVIITDEQADYGYSYVGSSLPDGVPLYTWNLAGYRAGHAPGSHNSHTFGGLSDAAFRMIPLLEAGRSANWPF